MSYSQHQLSALKLTRLSLNSSTTTEKATARCPSFAPVPLVSVSRSAVKKARTGVSLASVTGSHHSLATRSHTVSSSIICDTTNVNDDNLKSAERYRSSSSSSANTKRRLSGTDYAYVSRAAELAYSTTGLVAPHPRSACVLLGTDKASTWEAFKMGQGGTPAELLAVEAAGQATNGATLYMNLEPVYGLSSGEYRTVPGIVAAGITRVVIGILHPIPSLRYKAVAALRAEGIQVEVLEEREEKGEGQGGLWRQCVAACRAVNEAILHRIATGRPLSIFKYAMTLDGKIATPSGHSAWVSGPASREQVWQLRSCSDVVIIGTGTMRKDNPQLTTRRDDGHIPIRCVVSRSLDLPEEARLWDVSSAPTLVMTQRGVRPEFQRALASKGVEVVEFEEVTPAAVADYFAARGCLQLFWECGGNLAAPAMADQVIHKVLCFIAPKLIGGGSLAPSPVGNLGFQEMTEALQLAEVEYSQVGEDLRVVGYTPCSGGLEAVARRVAAVPLQSPTARAGARLSLLPQAVDSDVECFAQDACDSGVREQGEAVPEASSGSSEADGAGRGHAASREDTSAEPTPGRQRFQLFFYKAWDTYGALSNFSPFPITMPEDDGELLSWRTVEHFYQTRKFDASTAEGREVIGRVRGAASPEDAARIGRTAQRRSPHLVVPDWNDKKVGVMREALMAKFSSHAGPKRLLLSTAGELGGQQCHLDGEVICSGPSRLLVEDSPHDYIWGAGLRGDGRNLLGCLLIEVRQQLLERQQLLGELNERNTA